MSSRPSRPDGRATALRALVLLAGAALCGPAGAAGTATPTAADAATNATDAAAAASAAGGLAPFHASYLWYWHGAPVALSRAVFTHRGGDVWEYSSSTEPRGLGRLYPMRPQLRSTMRVDPQGVRPLTFLATGSGRAHDASVSFDWNTGRVTGTYEGAKVDMSISPGIQDDLSVQIQMLEQLDQGKAPDKVFEINRNAVREYDYRRVGEQTLSTAVGRIDTVIYESSHPGSARTTRFWCAPSRGYIPLQVQQKRLDAVEWTLRIQSLEQP